MNIQIQTFAFHVFFYSQAAANHAHDFQNQKAGNCAVGHGGERFFGLNQQLAADARFTAKHRITEEHAGEDGAD